MPPLGAWLKGPQLIEKENVRVTADGKCREWKVLTLGGFSSSPQTQYVCVGVADHLPWFWGTPNGPGEIRYFDWNVPIEILPPAPSSISK